MSWDEEGADPAGDMQEMLDSMGNGREVEPGLEKLRDSLVANLRRTNPADGTALGALEDRERRLDV